MAEEQRNTASAFPAPPPFYKYFTPENQQKLKELSHDGVPSSNSDDALQSNALPPELMYLVPPKPLTEGQYRSFGDLWNIPDRLPTLKELGIAQIFPDPEDESYNIDRAQELRRLSKSLLLNYLELVGILGIAPEQFDEKIYALRIHLINIHQLINEYRPHQARETLISMMEEQLERSKRETEENRAACRKVEDLLRSLKDFNAGGLITEEDGAVIVSNGISGDVVGVGVEGKNLNGGEKMEVGVEVVKKSGDLETDFASLNALQQIGLL